MKQALFQSVAGCVIFLSGVVGGVYHRDILTLGGTLSIPSAADAADPVVARVNDIDIRQSDIKAQMFRLDARLRQRTPQDVYPLVIDRIIDTRLAMEQAVKTGLDQDPVVQAVVAETQRQALASAFLNQEIAKAATPEVLKTLYDEYLKANPPSLEIKASHILLKTEDEAKAVIEALKGGADFIALAREKSKDPTVAQNAGDLGYFERDALPAAFFHAASQMDVGALSATPVQTEFGWHVILVGDKRFLPQRTFAEMEGELRNKVGAQTQRDVAKSLREKAVIQKFKWDGSPQPATPLQSTIPPTSDTEK